MYTSYIGKKFIEVYNRRAGTSYSAATFFERVMFPLFFDDLRHLMHVSNSPFFQAPAAKDLSKSGLSKSAYQFEKLKEKIKAATGTAGVAADASIYVGFAANGPDQTTAGQVTNLQLPITEEELYLSWIGNALAVRVEGSQCLLIDSEPVLWHLFEGWQKYRDFIDPVVEMDGRQIETWNGYWLARGALDLPASPPRKGGKLETSPWLPVLAKLMTWHPGETMAAYVFSLGQTNTTYGFINIHLPQFQQLLAARSAVKQSLFSAAGTDDEYFWRTYEPDLSLRDVCQMGEIGLRGLRPKDYGRILLENYDRTKITDKNRDTLSNIQTWIIAMLNNKSELQKLAASLATELVAAESSGSARERGKTSDPSESKALFEAKGLSSFITALAAFVEKRNTAAETCRAVVDHSVRLPGEQFPLFKALLRFEYIYLKSNK